MPFLVELRAVMDWVWTDTTLSLSNWMCVEDIYANIFIIKCSRETEKVLGPGQGCTRVTASWGRQAAARVRWCRGVLLRDSAHVSLRPECHQGPEGHVRGDSELGPVRAGSWQSRPEKAQQRPSLSRAGRAGGTTVSQVLVVQWLC